MIERRPRFQLLGLPSQNVGYAVCTLMNELEVVDVTAAIEQRDIGAHSKVPIEDLCKKTTDLYVGADMFAPVRLAQMTALLFNVDAIWKSLDGARYQPIKLILP